MNNRSAITAVLGPVAVLAALTCPACKKKTAASQDEDLKPVVADDNRIAREEDELLARRGVLQRERSSLRERRAEILTKKLSLDDADDQGRAELDKEATQLAGREALLAKQEAGITQKLQSFYDVLSKERAGASKEVAAARRELVAALREKDVARREADLAAREKILAAREHALAERQARGCPGRVTTVVAAPPAGGGSYGRRDVEPVYKAALAAMQNRGILTADLPPGVDRLVTEVRHSVSKGDYNRAKYAADQLLATVRGMKIDRGFIGAKIGRLNAAIRGNPLSADKRTRVTTLFQQATAAYGDGRFVEANRMLNRIYGLLH